MTLAGGATLGTATGAPTAATTGTITITGGTVNCGGNLLAGGGTLAVSSLALGPGLLDMQKGHSIGGAIPLNSTFTSGTLQA